jgi:hypothetical protein
LIPGDASHDKLGTAKRWRAAVLSPSHQYSKVVSQLSAAIIGRRLCGLDVSDCDTCA